MFGEMVGLFRGQTPDLIAERKDFPRFGFIVLDRFALAGKLSFVNLSLTFGREVRAGTHRERARDHAYHSRNDYKFAVAHGRAGYAGNNSEDCSEPVVDSVNGVADPGGCFWVIFLSRGKKFIERQFGLFGRGWRDWPAVADEPAQRLVVFALVFERLLEDANARFVAELLDLFRVLCDVAAFVQLQPPQRQPDTASTIG